MLACSEVSLPEDLVEILVVIVGVDVALVASVMVVTVGWGGWPGALNGLVAVGAADDVVAVGDVIVAVEDGADVGLEPVVGL
jgi:hypothetical protein